MNHFRNDLPARAVPAGPVPGALLDFVCGSVWAFDRAWGFAAVNGEGERLAGLPPAELLGRELWEVFPELCGGVFEQRCRAAAENPEHPPWSEQVVLRGRVLEAHGFPSESGFWLLFREETRPEPEFAAGEAGGSTGGVVLNGTSGPGRVERELRRAEDRLRCNHDTFYHLIQNNPFGVYLVDADFRLREVSLGSQNVFRNIRPLLGRDFAEVLRAVWPEPFATQAITRFRHTLATGEPYSSPSTVERRRDDGRVEAYDWRIERIILPDGRYGVVCYFYDLSERQRWEEELSAAKAAAEEASSAKSVFLANMSHELRTPLNAIIGYSEMILEGGNCPPDIRPDVEKISLSGNHLLELINAVLDLARIEAGRVEIIPAVFCVEELATWCVNGVRPTAARNGNTLSLACAPDCGMMNSDPAKVRQILLNLLGNAVKFTSSGTIGLTVFRRTTADGDMIAFEVQDNGIGIAPEDQGQLFQDFVQLDPSATKRYAGTGLGLSISRRLCRMLGGSISLTSAPGQGSRFTALFPAEYIPPATEPPPTDTASRS